MRRDGKLVEDISELAGLSQTNGWMAFALSMMMFSLAGIPPLAGFWAKFYVFSAAINAKLFTLAVVGVVTSVVGAYYYLRIVKLMYFDEPAPGFEPMSRTTSVVLAIATAVTVLFVVWPSLITAPAAVAAKALF